MSRCEGLRAHTERPPRCGKPKGPTQPATTTHHPRWEGTPPRRPRQFLTPGTIPQKASGPMHQRPPTATHPHQQAIPGTATAVQAPTQAGLTRDTPHTPPSKQRTPRPGLYGPRCTPEHRGRRPNPRTWKTSPQRAASLRELVWVAVRLVLVRRHLVPSVGPPRHPACRVQRQHIDCPVRMRPRPLVKLGDARLLCAMTTRGDGYLPSRPTWTHQVNPDGPPSTEARLATGIRTYG